MLNEAINQVLKFHGSNFELNDFFFCFFFFVFFFFFFFFEIAICITFEFNRSGLSVVTYCSPCIAFIYITIHQLTIHQLTIHQLCSGLVGGKQSVAPATAATAIYPARLLPHFTVTASQFSLAPWPRTVLIRKSKAPSVVFWVVLTRSPRRS